MIQSVALTNLNELLASMNPVLDKEAFVFCTFSDADANTDTVASLQAFATIRETEGLTVVATRTDADAHRLKYESVFRRITLQVHSSLDAVGLTAAVATELAGAKISANMIAGYFHDHVFVNADRADEAMSCLNELSTRYRTG